MLKSGRVLLGLLAGLAAGAVLGILFAPDKGEATRKKFTRKGEDLADDLKQKFNAFVDQLNNPQNADAAREHSEEDQPKTETNPKNN